MATISSTTIGINFPSLGGILGTSVSADLLSELNRSNFGAQFFGSAMDPFRQGFESFMTQVVTPIREAAQSLKKTADKMFMKDEIKPIITTDDLQHIPPSMHLPIVYYAPIRELLAERRIDGFGIDEKDLDVEDPYERLINNGRQEVNVDYLKKNDGIITFESRFESNDPQLTEDQLGAIEQTRLFLDSFLGGAETEHLDPTDYPSLRG